MAHRYSPFWDLREKKVPGSNPVVCQVKFLLAHFPMSLTLGVCQCLVRFGLLVLFCCASEKIRKFKKKKPK